MAQITGSSTIDWSDISVAQVDFETDIVTFANRVDEVFNDPDFIVVSFSPTLVVVLFDSALNSGINSGGIMSLGGSGFDTNNQIINSFNFKNPPDGTGEVLRFTGTLDGIGNDFFTSATIGSTGFSETINGNIIFPATFPDAGNITATLTSLVVKIDSAKVTIGGNFSLTGDQTSASLTGTVTGISVVSGTNTIKMTGLSLSLDVLEAALASDDLATVNDLFSVVGNQLASNDVITYTNIRRSDRSSSVERATTPSPAADGTRTRCMAAPATTSSLVAWVRIPSTGMRAMTRSPCWSPQATGIPSTPGTTPTH